MTDSRSSPDPGASVCPFVALAEDRDRRADAPDEGNRCYAEKAPRRRDLVYQSDYCYAADFASCSVFLGWAARNAAEPAYVTEAASKAWGSGIAAPEEMPAGVADARGAQDASAQDAADPDGEAEPAPTPTPEGGLFGPPEPSEPDEAKGAEQLDWISASAWTEAPWDERAEMEADELEAIEAEDEDEDEFEEEEDEEPAEEATQAPKVPAALPMRRRKPPQEPIRSRGSGEWFFADPPGREPLVSRRSTLTPTILLAILGVLVVSIVVFLIATQIGGGDEPAPVAASPSPAASIDPAATRAPVATAAPSVEPSPPPKPRIRTWTVKPGQSLSWIAARPRVSVDPKLLQCINRITNPDIIQPGQVLRIPPEGYTCPKGWRRSTPEPLE